MNYTLVGFREFEDGYIDVIDLSDGTYRSECIEMLMTFKKILSSGLFSKSEYMDLPADLAFDFSKLETGVIRAYLNFRRKYKENFGIDPEIYLEYFREERNEDKKTNSL